MGKYHNNGGIQMNRVEFFWWVVFGERGRVMILVLCVEIANDG